MPARFLSEPRAFMTAGRGKAANWPSISRFQVSPYSRGVETRRLRLVPNVNTAVTAVTATTRPTTALRTGMAVRPRPGCRAMRTPVTAEGARPVLAADSATREGWVVSPARRARSEPIVVAARHAVETTIARATTRIARSPSPRTAGFTETPGSGSA